MNQPALFPLEAQRLPGVTHDPDFVPDLDSYDTIIIAFSGGKDCTAAFLRLMELGVDVSRIEFWHHEIDGREGSTLMDWPVTPAYCRAFAAAFNCPIYFQWKEGGFEREMLRDNQPTAPTWFELPDGTLGTSGGNGQPNTRLMFPQVTANLAQRWCSAYLKIDVCASAIRNQDRFNRARTLLISGERAEESPGRSKYATFEPNKADGRNGRMQRHVDHWRPVHAFEEEKVWEILERWGINPHPAYKAGYSRVSCRHCIFGNDDQWASGAVIDPAGIQVLTGYEDRFGKTIHRTRPIGERVAVGKPYAAITPSLMEKLNSKEYTDPIIIPRSQWQLPAGAFGHSCGPT